MEAKTLSLVTLSIMCLDLPPAPRFPPQWMFTDLRADSRMLHWWFLTWTNRRRSGCPSGSARVGLSR